MYVFTVANRQRLWFILEKHIKMKITIPHNANYIIHQLQKHGYEAYVVGGCVRDSILGRNPEDWDITTSASPEQVKEIFRRTVDTGIQHGTVTVLVEQDAYEVTTYRVDGKYEDHRRPDSVTFTQCLEEDLLRRDFTMNAMAYNDERGLVDLYHGLDDLNNGIIRCVGVASQRFDEDALRILRAYRFAAQLGFTIEEETRKAAKEQCRFLQDISAERIRVELTKLITGAYPEKLLDAAEAGITDYVLPEFDGMETMKMVQAVESDVILRWTMLLHDVGEEHAVEILQRLKFDNYTIKTVRRLIRWQDYPWQELDRRIVRRAVAQIGEDIFPLLIKVQRADVMAQCDYQSQETLEKLVEIQRLYQEILDNKECISLKDLQMNGGQLMELGIPQGPMLGQKLHELLEQVIEEPALNDYEQLKKIVLEER
jgi:tRNA nucleotidyltransferase (CCA-adding enzyme)